MSLCIDFPVIAIVPIDDPRAQDTLTLTNSGKKIFYSYSTSTAISKDCGEHPCVPRLTSYSKAPTGLFSYPAPYR